jgi:membrane-associated protease RseP (regulator of RpoE activity)
MKSGIMNTENIRELDNLVGHHFQPDFWARMQGRLLYRADEEFVQPGEIEQITTALKNRGLFPHVEKRNGEYLLFILPQDNAKKASKAWVNLLLFVATVITTMIAGAFWDGRNFFEDFSQILYGWKYSLAVLAILTSHEMGHYIAARLHKIRVTLPYYLPLPFLGLGTLGAFIRIKSQFSNRNALLDVGVAGPLAGIVVSLIFLILGYATLPNFEGIVAYVETIHPWDMQGGVNIVLGKSLLFSFFNDFIGNGRLPMNEVYHFPFIFAGWIGILVTAINLIPIGQLDGGHILYSLIRDKARRVGLISFFALFILNIYLLVEFKSSIWVLWIILILILIRFRHPPTFNDNMELTPLRRFLGWLCLFIFAICFIPMPIDIQ